MKKSLYICVLIILWMGLVNCKEQPAAISSQHSGAFPVSVARVVPFDPAILGQLTSTPKGDRLSFQIPCPSCANSRSFKTAILDLNRIRFFRVWVKGTHIASAIWNDEGYATVTNLQNTRLSVSSVPKGHNRIVTAQGYDSNRQPIPGAMVKGYYSSPSGPGMVQVFLKWRFTPVGQALEALLNQGEIQITQHLDTVALQRLIDQQIYPNGDTQQPYVMHPSRMATQAIASYLQQTKGNLVGLAAAPTNWPTAINKEIIVQNPQGGALTHEVTLWIDDPASTAITLPAGSDRGTVSNIAPGTWNVTAQVQGLNGVVKSQAQITVDEKGTVTLSPSGVLTLPPVLTGTLVTGMTRSWQGEGNAQDLMATNHGVLQNGTAFAVGKTGQAFRFDGLDDHVNVTGGGYCNNEISHTFWIKPTLASAQQGILYGPFPNIGDLNPYQSIMLDNSKIRVLLKLENSAGGITLVDQSSNQSLNSGQWHHVAVTLHYNPDTGNRELKIYLNGALDKAFTLYTAPNGTNWCSSHWVMGRGSDGGAFKYYQGLLDEVMRYNRALTASEVQTLFSNQPTGAAGDSLMLLGDNFIPGQNTVLFGSTNAAITGGNGTTSLQVTIPNGVGGQVPITVITNGKTSNALLLSVLPKITGFSANTAMIGDVVTISGFNFTGATQVMFNNVATNFTVIDDTTISATVPAAALGLVSVTTPYGIGYSTANFIPRGLSCKAFKTSNGSLADGVYRLDPDGNGAGLDYDAYCDMTTAGGGWTALLSPVLPGLASTAPGLNFSTTTVSGAGTCPPTISNATANNWNGKQAYACGNFTFKLNVDWSNTLNAQDVMFLTTVQGQTDRILNLNGTGIPYNGYSDAYMKCAFWNQSGLSSSPGSNLCWSTALNATPYIALGSLAGNLAMYMQSGPACSPDCLHGTGMNIQRLMVR